MVYRNRSEADAGLEWGSYQLVEKDGKKRLEIDLDGVPCVSMPEWDGWIDNEKNERDHGLVGIAHLDVEKKFEGMSIRSCN